MSPNIPGLSRAQAAKSFGALGKVAAAVSSNTTAAVSKHNPVDATSGALNIVLPTGAAEGKLISVEKIDSTMNAVTISGNIRGAVSTVVLALAHETVLFIADSAGSWWPQAGHKTLSSLDSRYATLRTQTRAGNVIQGLRPIATRNRVVHARDSAANSQSDGTHLIQTSILQHQIVETAFGVRLVFGNSAWWNTITTQYQITVTAAVKYSGTVFQVTFGGKTSTVIDPMCYVTSDPLGITLKGGVGGNVEVRTSVTIASGAKFPAAMLVSTGEGRVDDSDATMVGSPSANGTSAYPVYGVSAIVGQCPNPARASVLIYGDSIMQGVGGVTTAQQPLDSGWVCKALNNQFGYIQASLYGDSASNLVPAGRDRAKFIGTTDYMLCGMGSNDIYVSNRTLAQLQADLIALWQRATWLGSRVLQTTITPRTTSTDAWATTTNQTITNAGLNTIRINLNDWLRDGAPMTSAFVAVAVGTSTAGTLRIGSASHPLYGILDVADGVETARNSGIWRVSGSAPTSDGIHPTSTTGEALFTAAVNLNTALPLF